MQKSRTNFLEKGPEAAGEKIPRITWGFIIYFREEFYPSSVVGRVACGGGLRCVPQPSAQGPAAFVAEG